MTGPALVVFDLAGTTIEDDGQVPGAFAEALHGEGIDVTLAQVHEVRGSSKREALMRFIPDAARRPDRVDAVYGRFRAGLVQRYSSSVRAIPGAVNAFVTLRNKDVRVALATGFDRDTTTRLLDALGWTPDLVGAVVCGDEVTAGRPAPYLIYHAMELTGTYEVRSVATVGDTALDLHAGFNAGVGWNIGVLSGAHDRETLTAAPHTHLIASVAALESVWQER